MSLRKKILGIGLVSLFITCLLLAAIFKTSVHGIALIVLLGLAVFFGLTTWLTLFAAFRARPLDDISTNIWSEIFNLIF